jgi:thymidylate synthase (FAD)
VSGGDPNWKIDCLDHGYVRLVDSMGDDLSIVRAARVSYDAAWRTGTDEGSDHKLINSLMRRGHTSPFEAVEFQFEVMAPIFVLRQWHRHRTWAYNELSGRYRELPDVYYVPRPQDIGVQSKTSKQARAFDVEHMPDIDTKVMAAAMGASFEIYRMLLAQQVPKELARIVLPLATYSHMFAKVDLHNLFHFLKLRLHEHAQYEIREYGLAILDLIQLVVPTAVSAWLDQDGMRENVLKLRRKKDDGA